MNLGYFKLQTGEKLRSLLTFSRADLALLGIGRKPREMPAPATETMLPSTALPGVPIGDLSNSSEPDRDPLESDAIRQQSHVLEFLEGMRLMDEEHAKQQQEIQASIVQLHNMVEMLQKFVESRRSSMRDELRDQAENHDSE